MFIVILFFMDWWNFCGRGEIYDLSFLLFMEWICMVFEYLWDSVILQLWQTLLSRWNFTIVRSVLQFGNAGMKLILIWLLENILWLVSRIVTLHHFQVFFSGYIFFLLAFIRKQEEESLTYVIEFPVIDWLSSRNFGMCDKIDWLSSSNFGLISKFIIFVDVFWVVNAEVQAF